MEFRQPAPQSITEAMPQVFGWAVLGLEWVHTGEAVVEYVERTGRYPNDSVVVDGIRIGAWLRRQRKLIGSDQLLDQRRLSWLEEYLPSWNLSATDRDWYAMGHKLLEFVREELRYPTSEEHFQGSNIGAWLRRQRYASQRVDDGALDPARARYLNVVLPGWKVGEVPPLSVLLD